MMAQAQLEVHTKEKNTYFVDFEGQVTVKLWKKKNHGVNVTMMKHGTKQNLTLPFEIFRNMLEAQDVLLLAADFLRGLVGVSPTDLAEDPNA